MRNQPLSRQQNLHSSLIKKVACGIRNKEEPWAVDISSILITFILVLGSAATAGGQGVLPAGEQLQLNTYKSGRQQTPAVVALPGDRFVVVWSSYGSGGSDTDRFSIQGQRLAVDGTMLGSQFQVNDYTDGRQDVPAVAALAGGDFVVVWKSDGSAGSDTEASSIQGRRFASDGSPRGSDFQVNSFTPGGQAVPAVAALADGDFVVVWQSYGSEPSELSSIRGRRFASAGQALGAEVQINTPSADDHESPAVAGLAGGEFVVTWATPNYFAGSYEQNILARRYSSAGEALGDELEINATAKLFASRPAVAGLADGGFVVTWDSYVNEYGTNTHGRTFSPDGTPRIIDLSLSHGSQDERRSAVDSLDNGDFVVVWDTYQFYFDVWSIEGRRLAADGAPVGDSFRATDGTQLIQHRDADVAISESRRMLVVWSSRLLEGSAPSGFDIQGRSYRMPCVADDKTLCLNGGRFEVKVTWRDFEGGVGPGRDVLFGSDDSGLLWFFDPDNWEMLIKVLDGCGFNGHFWVFAAATTNVEYTLRVTDTETGLMRSYFNPLGTTAPALTDTEAFATCP